MSANLLVIPCGVLSYDEASAAQRRLAAARQAEEVPDLLLLLQHPPVYTRGRRSSAAELPMGAEWYEAQGIEVRDTDRGGRVTYHGPGQLVAYPILSLRPYGEDVHAYVRRMEAVTIEALAEHGVQAGTIDGLTGVWTLGEAPGTGAGAGEAQKIGSIGVHVSRAVTTHGLAVNVDNDLQPFEWIVPCGIEGARMTSLARERGQAQDVDAFGKTIAACFGEVYGREPVLTDPAELGLGPAAARLRI